MLRRLWAILALTLPVWTAHAQGVTTIEQAIRTAVATNPRVAEAAANRRAVDFEVRQVQGALLPQVRASAEYGNERYRQFDGLRSADSNDWRKAGGQGGIVVTQLLFDGFSTVNQIYRQMARSDAAAWRTFERAELVALDAAEAYLDVIRFSASLAHARANLARHRAFETNVRARLTGGRAGIGDADQVRERLNATEAVLADMSIRLEEAKAAYRRAVGAEPRRLSGARRLSGLPRSRADALSATIAANPTLRAAASDVTAAEREYDASAGLHAPNLYLQGQVAGGRDSSARSGNFDDASAKIRMSWTLFSGGTDSARRSELIERVTETKMRMDGLRRSAFESVDRAWGVRAMSGARIAALESQVRAAKSVVQAYDGEYQLGQRTILDLLNAQNALFNAQLSLEAARSVAVFSDYQLLATSGQLLARLNIPRPLEGSLRTSDQRGLLGGIATMPEPRR